MESARKISLDFLETLGPQFRKWWQAKSPCFNIHLHGQGGSWNFIYPDDFPFSITAKFKTNMDLWTLFSRKTNSPIIQWWDQACVKAREEGKDHPLLIIKKHYFSPLVLFYSEEVADTIEEPFHLTTYVNTSEKIFIYELNEFFTILPEVFRRESGEHAE